MRSQIAVLDHDGEVEANERQRCDAHGDPVEPCEAWARESPLAKSHLGAELGDAPSTKMLGQRLGRCLFSRGGGLRGHLRYLGCSCRQVLARDFATSPSRWSSSCIPFLLILAFHFPFELHQHLPTAIRPCNILFLLV